MNQLQTEWVMVQLSVKGTANDWHFLAPKKLMDANPSWQRMLPYARSGVARPVKAQAVSRVTFPDTVTKTNT